MWNERFSVKEYIYGTEPNAFLAEHGSRLSGPVLSLVERSLLPGGLLLMEAYTEDQLQRDTGGPKDLDMLMSKAKIEQEFPNLEPVLIQEIEREVCEGTYHTGMASVVQFIGKKA